MPDVAGLAIGTRPDCLTPQAYDFLVDFIVRNKALFVVTGFLGSATVMFLAAMFQDFMLSP